MSGLLTAPQNRLHDYRSALRQTGLTRRIGWVLQMQGLAIEAQGPDATIGELCRIVPRGSLQASSRNEDATLDAGLMAEVVGLNGGRLTLMPYGSVAGIAAGAEVVALGQRASIGVGSQLLGRVIDGFGHAMDGRPDPWASAEQALHGEPLNPMQRPRIDRILQTGVRGIDGLLTLGLGQRVGIFAGSGVGKSTLLGMIARHVTADVNVIALIGERGREVREFIDKQLGVEGLRRSIVVVATSDQPAMARIRAAHAAVAISEYFRDAGRQVLLTMDSITRLAMARREVGLASGEPPTARGFTPSVFAELPRLCERCGTSSSGGSITALLTVLVEGDDLNEPISDTLRSILDGHIVLSRQLAHRGQYPAIDVLKSASRLLPDLTTPQDQALVAEATRHLSMLERNRQMVDIGAYEKGANPLLDEALAAEEGLHRWLSQRDGGVDRATALKGLADILAGSRRPPPSSHEARTNVPGQKSPPPAAVAGRTGQDGSTRKVTL